MGIKWSAVDFENMTIALNHTVVPGRKVEYREDTTKTESSNSVVPLVKMVSDRLKEWKNQQDLHRQLQPNDYVDEGYVCAKIDGMLIKPGYVSKHFKWLLAENGLPHIRFHDLRHSAAGYLK